MDGDTELDNALVIDAAFQIIDASLNTKDLFQEMCHLSTKLQEDGANVSMTDLLSVTCRQMQENKDGLSDKSIMATPALAQEVIRLAEKEKHTQSSSSRKKSQEQWRVCLGLIKESLRRGVFIPSLFTSWISKRGLSIEFLWDLHEAGAYNFDSHLSSKVKEPKCRTQLSQTLINLCRGVEEGDDNSSHALHQELILTGVTTMLVNKSFTEDHDSKGKESKMYLAILDLLLEGTMDLSLPSGNQRFISPFSGLGSGDVSEVAKKKFSRHALSFCLQHKADFIISEHAPSVTEYKPNDVDKFLELFIKQLQECLSAHESLGVLNHCLKCDQVKSRTTKAFLAAFLSMSQRSTEVVLDYIRTSLTSSLQDSDASQVMSGFYVARTCCSVNNAHFPSYRDWYQQTFGEAATSIAGNRTSFTFLIKCLTQWVPQDDPEYLKAHILRRPFIPARMREVYDSYIALAKTRLDDLKIPIRDVSSADSTFKNDATSSKEQQMIQMQQEVDRCVKAFEETGKIPTTILEASIFRKPYYVGKFLPALLKPRCLPDRPDSRMRLIDEMRKSGKVPSVMLNAYTDGCEREKQNLLEGVFDVDDEGDDMLMSPLEQLQFRLDRLADSLECRDDKKKATESLSHVKERVHELVMTQPKYETYDQDTIAVSLSEPMDSLHEQIISKFISCLHRGYYVVLNDGSMPTTEARGKLFGLEEIVDTLVHFPVMRTALVKYLLVCLNKKTLPDGVSPHCWWVASVCVVFARHRWSLRVTDQNGGTTHCWDNLVEACDYFLSRNCQGDTSFVLRCYLAILYHAMNRLDPDPFLLEEDTDVIELPGGHLPQSQLLSASVIKKIKLLCTRHRLKRADLDTLSQPQLLRLHKDLDKYDLVLSSDWWKRLVTTHQPTLDDWVKFELGMNPSTDVLAKRLRLSYFWETCGVFIRDVGLSAVCSTLLRLLADTSNLSEGNEFSVPRDDSFGDLVSLLKGLLLQLPVGIVDGDRRPWLLSTVTSCQERSLRSRMLSLSLLLHPHLLVCNNKHDRTRVDDDSIPQPTSELLDLYAESDLNCGGYFPLDVTIFILQTSDCFLHSVDGFVKFLGHPAVFTSLMVHQGSLQPLGMMSSCPEVFKHQLEAVSAWVDRLKDWRRLELMEEDDDDNDYDDDGEDWMKASALFAFLINEGQKEFGTVKDFISNGQDTPCLPYLWELLTAWLIHNLDKTEIDIPSQAVHQLFLLENPSIVARSLSRQTSSHAEFGRRLGVHPDLEHIRMFSILRGEKSEPASEFILGESYLDAVYLERNAVQCSAVSVSDISADVCNTLSSPLVSAYANLLEGMDRSLDMCKKVPLDDLSSISSWLQSLAASCHSSHLSNIDLKTLQSCDPLLYRKIYLKTR